MKVVPIQLQICITRRVTIKNLLWNWYIFHPTSLHDELPL